MNGTRTKLCNREYLKCDLGVSVASKGEGDDEGECKRRGESRGVAVLGCFFLVLPECGEGTGFCFRA